MRQPPRFTHARILNVEEKRQRRQSLWYVAKQNLVDEGTWGPEDDVPTQSILTRFDVLCKQNCCFRAGTRDEHFKTDFRRPPPMKRQRPEDQLKWKLDLEYIKPREKRKHDQMKAWINEMVQHLLPGEFEFSQRYQDTLEKYYRMYKLPGFVYKKTTRYDKPPA